jgi:recombinational DNA repair protein (RecF pathway)
MKCSICGKRLNSETIRKHRGKVMCKGCFEDIVYLDYKVMQFQKVIESNQRRY